MALQDQLRAARDDRPPPTPRNATPPRWDLVAAWLVVLLPALAILSVLAARQRVADLEERLVHDVNALFGRSSPRPVHVDAPSPGGIGDMATRHLQSIAPVAKRLQDDAAVLAKTREVVAGATPVAALPPSVIAALADIEPDLDALLAATRTERADFPDSLDAVGTGGWAATWQIAATLAGVRMRMALAAGEPRRALRDGLDALALGRDVAIAHGLIGRMVGAAIVSRLAPPVSAAADALRDPADRLDALRRLRVIRDALPPFSRTLGDESIYTQLYMGEALSTRVRSALDPRAGAMVREGLRDTTWWTRLMVRDGWRDLRKAQDAVVAAADLPEAERTAAWKDVEARLRRVANPYAAIGLPDYGRYARRAEASVRRLDALVLAAAAGAFRDSLGRWPRSVAEIASFGAIDAEEAARLGEAELRVGPDGGGLSLIVPLPRADEKEPGDMRLVLRGSAAGD